MLAMTSIWALYFVSFLCLFSYAFQYINLIPKHIIESPLEAISYRRAFIIFLLLFLTFVILAPDGLAAAENVWLFQIYSKYKTQGNCWSVNVAYHMYNIRACWHTAAGSYMMMMNEKRTTSAAHISRRLKMRKPICFACCCSR